MQREEDRDQVKHKVREAWDTNADYWDQQMGEGNEFHRLLVSPAQKELLGLKPGELVLDVACGNGQFTREMADLGASVVAFDASERMIAHARRRTIEHGGRIEYRVLDATDEDALAELGPERFDAAVCTMAIMDISEVGPLLRGLAGLLKPDGRLVFSVLHPCFNFHGATMVAEEQQKDSDLVVTYSIKVTDYADDVATLGVAMKGQPTPHYYFHRPLGELFSACFEAGLVLDGLREPVFGADATPGHPVGWGDYRTVPPVMVARLRRGA